MAEDKTMGWPQIVTTVDLPDVELDEATRAKMAAHIATIEAKLWEALFYKATPAEPPPSRCKCRGPLHDLTCVAWCT